MYHRKSRQTDVMGVSFQGGSQKINASMKTGLICPLRVLQSLIVVKRFDHLMQTQPEE